MPPFEPPAQFTPPHTQTSMLARPGIAARVAPTRPPSGQSNSATPVAFGLMPKPNAVSRSVKDDVLVSETPTVRKLVLKPLTVIEPLPVKLPVLDCES